MDEFPFTTGNPFLGTKLLGFSIGRGSGALKGLIGGVLFFFCLIYMYIYILFFSSIIVGVGFV